MANKHVWLKNIGPVGSPRNKVGFREVKGYADQHLADDRGLNRNYGNERAKAMVDFYSSDEYLKNIDSQPIDDERQNQELEQFHKEVGGDQPKIRDIPGVNEEIRFQNRKHFTG